MSEYGLRIKNIEASTLYATNNGAREDFEYKNAMFTNSLLLDFLIDNGLQTWKEKSTRDIIGIDFNFGSYSYEEEVQHLNKIRNKYIELELEDKIKKIDDLIEKANINKDKFIKKSKDELRDIFYREGINVTYVTKNKKGEIKKIETIHYKMLYRSTGKAKKGNCMFIRDKLYNKAIKFLRMGIDLPLINAPIVEISAYAPLVASTIIEKIRINPKNILIIKDIDSFFKTNVISVETDENKCCVAKSINDYQVKNTLFDGQALIDSSLFPSWADGYILLRHHFCKMAAFNTNIQLFFKDYFGEKYVNAKIVDMFGNEHYAKDIELITTDNSMKWLKFDISYEYWCNRVFENNCMFGIVKTAHESKLGDVQRMSYQMINALDIDIMPKVVEKSLDYIIQLKTNDDIFLDYLSKNSNFSNDYEVLIALVEQDKEFLRSEYFRVRKKRIIEAYVKNFKSGKIIQNADNLVIIGSPFAMLLASVHENVELDDTFCVEYGAIQCFTKRFENNEYLAEFRSPFNSKNNMGYLHNVYNEKMFKYFDLGKQIIAVNMIHTDFQDRNNGSDQDSDSLYVTNQIDIVNYAKYCYLNFLTIVNNIPKENKSYENNLANYARIDNNLADAQLSIGEASNLAQIALTYSYNFKDQKYQDYVCILSVLAQVAIDNAKRKFDIDLTKEIKRIKKDMNLKDNKYPEFWLIVKKGFNKNNINKNLKCPMNYLCELKIKEFKPKESTLPMNNFFVKYEIDENRRKSKKVEDLIYKYSFNLYQSNYQEDEDDFLLLRADFDEMIKDIKSIYISNNYVGLMSWLVNRAFYIGSGVKRNKMGMLQVLEYNKSILLKTLYEINKKSLLKCFKIA